MIARRKPSPAAVPPPPLIVDAAYAEKLESLALGTLRRFPAVARRLLEELSRAEVRPAVEIPPGVVTIGSDVRFRDEMTGRERTLRLVLPSEADIAAGRVSVLTPIGAALIGMAEGACIDWQTPHGEGRCLTVLAVDPPASGGAA